MLVTTLETTPADATHWSTRSLARHLGMSQSAISRIWRAVGLKPRRGPRPPDQDPAEAAAGAGVAVGLEQPDPDGGRPCLGAAVVEGDDPPGAGPRKDMPWAPCWLLPMPCP